MQVSSDEFCESAWPLSAVPLLQPPASPPTPQSPAPFRSGGQTFRVWRVFVRDGAGAVGTNRILQVGFVCELSRFVGAILSLGRR